MSHIVLHGRRMHDCVMSNSHWPIRLHGL